MALVSVFKADDKSERRDQLEIDQGLDADASNSLEVLHSGDAVHDGAEDDRCNQHFDHLDEGVAERLHLLAELWIEISQQDADNDRGEHLEVEMRIERLACRRRCGRLSCLHDVLPTGSPYGALSLALLRVILAPVEGDGQRCDCRVPHSMSPHNALGSRRNAR
jgi:hypothetical protein